MYHANQENQLEGPTVLVVWHPDFMDGNGQPQELHVVKKYWKVETEDCSEYFFDAVEENTTAATELAAPPTLPEVIDTEVVGTNDGGVNDLLNALNRVMELMMTISLHQKTFHPQLMEQLMDCPF